MGPFPTFDEAIGATMKSREPKTTDRFGWVVPDGLELLQHRRPLMMVDRRALVDLQVRWGMSKADEADTRVGVDAFMLRWDVTVEEALQTTRLFIQQAMAILELMASCPPDMSARVAAAARAAQDALCKALGTLGVIEKAVLDDERLYALDNQAARAAWEVAETRTDLAGRDATGGDDGIGTDSATTAPDIEAQAEAVMRKATGRGGMTN